MAALPGRRPLPITQILVASVKAASSQSRHRRDEVARLKGHRQRKAGLGCRCGQEAWRPFMVVLGLGFSGE
jgi:hypothetical protein